MSVLIMLFCILQGFRGTVSPGQYDCNSDTENSSIKKVPFIYIDIPDTLTQYSTGIIVKDEHLFFFYFHWTAFVVTKLH